MVIRSITLFFLLNLLSCTLKKAAVYKELIIGEWTFVNKQPKTGNDELSPLSLEQKQGYVFSSDSNCDNKLGYFKEVRGKNLFDYRYIYLGTRTKYSIDNDSLKIFDLNDSIWKSQKISNITIDTLTIQADDSTILKYSKAKYIIDSNKLFDQIIVSSSNCYGSCPVNDISINRNGHVLYFGDSYNTINGLYQSEVDSSIFSKIETDFKKANIQMLHNKYDASWSDDQTVSVTFIKNKRIVKTISDYARQSPAEFYWAYLPVRYLYQQIPLSTMTKIPIQQIFKNTLFTSNGKYYWLNKSEGFFLWSLLINSSLTEKPLATKYSVIMLTLDKLDYKKIETDGQLFKFTMQNGATKTYDIGFNFITENNLIQNNIVKDR